MGSLRSEETGVKRINCSTPDYIKYVRDRRYHKLNQIKMERGCKDCGYKKHPKALHFDHIVRENKHIILDAAASGGGGKMSRMVKRINLTDKKRNREYIKELFNEVKKCEVRCANCHSIRTWEELHYMPNVRKGKKIIQEEPYVKQQKFNF